MSLRVIGRVRGHQDGLLCKPRLNVSKELDPLNSQLIQNFIRFTSILEIIEPFDLAPVTKLMSIS